MWTYKLVKTLLASIAANFTVMSFAVKVLLELVNAS